MSTRQRGVVQIDNHVTAIEQNDYSFLQDLDLGFHLVFEDTNFTFAAVDIFASIPLYYTILDGKPLVSENIDELLRYIPKPTFDPIGFYCSTGNFKNIRTQNSPFKEIQRIPAGSYIEFKNSNFRITKYWSFEKLKENSFSGNLNEASEILRNLLKGSIKDCLSHDENCSLHLSGGLDSGFIAALVAAQSDLKRNAYHINYGNKSEITPNSESYFVEKYKNLYPNLNIETFDSQATGLSNTHYLPSAGNWFGILNARRQIEILKSTKDTKTKTILTGLGGDEFSSVFYHQGLKKVKPIDSIKALRHYNFWNQNILQRFLAFKNDIRKNSLSKSLRNDKFRKINFNPNYIFSKAFKPHISPYLNFPSVPLSRTPMTLNFRLDQFSRSFFTIRSDKWNFLGSDYEIDFIHPLLHKKIVSFCLSLPFKLFTSHPARTLIKMAVAKDIDDELTRGTKRPSKRDFTTEDWQDLNIAIQRTKEKIMILNNSKAKAQFDFDAILDVLSLIYNNQIAQDSRTFHMVGSIHARLLKVIFCSNYINKHFEH